MTKKRALIHALSYLSYIQSHNGSFESKAFFVPEGPSEIRTTTFHSSWISLCISLLPESETKRKVQNGIKQFLLEEKSSDWSFNYWQKDSPQYRSVPCPDDHDDTSLALAAFSVADPSLITEGAMVAILNNLILTELKPGGPYNTWIVDQYRGTSWEDTDLVVNSNIAYFLSLQEIELSELTSFIEEKIRKNDLSSTYYGEIATIYSIARWYKGPLAKNLEEKLVSLFDPKNYWGDIAHTAMATSALLRLGSTSGCNATAIASILKSQHVDGSWNISPIYVEQIKKQRPEYSGSRALSTALCIEAITLHEKQKRILVKKPDILADRILHRALQRFDSSSEELRIRAKQGIQILIEKDGSLEIPLLVHRFVKASSFRVPLSEQILLGSINVLGWLGYTIYDKVLDGEDMISQIPLANICIREVATTFQTLLPPSQYRAVRTILDGIEKTNLWEHTSCKLVKNGSSISIPKHLPSYGDLGPLAQKSLGHALGAITIAYRYSKKKGATYARQLQKFFEHYLIARQLNDDAHDWFEDLEGGFLNSVSVLLLRDQVGSTINLESDALTLKKLFWEKCIDEVAERTAHHCAQARKILSHMSFIHSPKELESLIIPLEKSAVRALKERNRTNAFLAAYTPIVPQSAASTSRDTNRQKQ